MPRNSPTPTAPPIAIIWIWRLPRDFLYPSSPLSWYVGMGPVAGSLGSKGMVVS
ncbi:hypothetical protein GKZ75_07125 [Kocuria indica]|uniref:Uncharacterized protein n=1 Tax=Kocuria marina subsp. indica TaxID=1049583 RepID=A0A6N9QYJ8_9MICC|nr:MULTISPECIES: hypothetical protein [Kocuria]NDO78004.1 hypothetical protein [Kocuria indica]